MNYHELLNSGKRKLAAAGKAENDAKELLLFIKDWRLRDYLLWGGAEASAAETERYTAMLARRMAGVPLQEITGRQNFYGYEISVSSDVLTPRPETELLVELALKEIAGLTRPRVLDLCTGSGCIAVAVTAENPAAEMVAVDISEKALALARKNGERYGLAGRIQWRQSDLFTGLAGEKFDIIVSNPPYIATAEMAGLDAEVRNYDPPLALDGGADGLDFYRRIAEQAVRYLRKSLAESLAGDLPSPMDVTEKERAVAGRKPVGQTETGGESKTARLESALPGKEAGGRLLLEIGCGQGAAVAELLRRNGWRAIRILPDLAGRERIVTATVGKKAEK